MPTAAKGGNASRSASHGGIKNDIAGVAEGINQVGKERDRLLRRMVMLFVFRERQHRTWIVLVGFVRKLGIGVRAANLHIARRFPVPLILSNTIVNQVSWVIGHAPLRVGFMGNDTLRKDHDVFMFLQDGVLRVKEVGGAVLFPNARILKQIACRHNQVGGERLGTECDCRPGRGENAAEFRPQGFPRNELVPSHPGSLIGKVQHRQINRTVWKLAKKVKAVAVNEGSDGKLGKGAVHLGVSDLSFGRLQYADLRRCRKNAMRFSKPVDGFRTGWHDPGMQPPQYRIGLERGRATQTERAARRDHDIWTAIIEISYRTKARTLREFANHLNAMQVETARGGVWTVGLVHAAMKLHGVNPKSLLLRVTTPRTFEPRTEPTVEQYTRWRIAMDELTNDGAWLPLVGFEVNRNARIRHRELGEGQFVREAGAKVVGSFMDWEDETFGTFETEVRPIDVEVFRHRLTPIELERANDRLKATYLSTL